LPETLTASEIDPDFVAVQEPLVELVPDAEVAFGVDELVAVPPDAHAAREAARPMATTRERAVRTEILCCIVCCIADEASSLAHGSYESAPLEPTSA
jgi:hypothetical protein